MFLKLFTTVLLASSAFASLKITPAAQAQPPETIANEVTANGATANETTANEATAADLQISPHFGIDLHTPRNGDNGNSFGRVSAFLPLLQTSGRHLTFINAAGRVDTAGNLGGNVALGHRFALSRDTVLGGYLAYDVRDTGQNTFSQIGLGAELMGENWTAQLNGYIPVGETTVPVGETTSGTPGAGVQFQNNQLVLLVAGGIQMFESALGSVEAGASVKLADLGAYGDLWGVGSAYYVSDAVGGSVQLDHRLDSRLRIGLGAQSDGIFGTQVFASVGTRFGTGGRPTGRPQTNLWPQLAPADINRNSSILVRSEVRETPTQALVALNPETGQAYRFRHVVPDAAAANQGDGTAESPFTTLGAGAADAANTGLSNVSEGEMVYVRAGDSRTNAIAPFTIPAGVQVYSDAIATTLPTQFGDISLPGTGTNIRPLINGSGSGGTGITLSGGNNRVSGFEIDSSTNGISLNNPSGTVTVENNLISNTTNRALSLAQSTGTANVVINSNTIDTATQDGIRVELTNAADLTLALTNNQINNITASDGDGIDIEANNTSRANLTLSNNQIDQAGNSGIELETCGNTTTTACNASFSATVTGNTVSRSGGDGILFFHNSNQPAQLTLENNQVQQSGLAQTGVTNNAGNPLPVPGNGGFGILAATFADGDLTVTIENNTVTDTQDEKIALINNLVTNDASALTPTAPTINASIQNNTVSGTGTGLIAANDISVISGSTPGSPNLPSVCLQLTGNTAPNGYFLTNGLTGTPNPPFPPTPIPIASPGTFAQLVGNTTDSLITSGTVTFQTLPQSALGPVTVTSAESTTNTCTFP